jgi:transposase-like protein
MEKLKIPLDEINRLYVDEKLTLREIEEIAGVTYQTVHNHLKAQGIELRSRKFRRNKYPRFERELMYDMYVTKGLSMEEIGRKLGFSGTTIRKELACHGIKSGRWRRNTPETKAIQAKAVQLYKKGWTVKQIAAHLNKYPEAIYKALKQVGIELRYLKLVRREFNGEELQRLYVDDALPVKQICEKLGVTRKKFESELIRHGIPIRVGKSQRRLRYPKLEKLQIGEHVLLPRGKKLNYHMAFYDDARRIGIQVSVETIDQSSVRVTRVC